MKEFTIAMLSIDVNGIDYTTELSIKANTANEAVIKAMNWLTEQQCAIVKIGYISELNTKEKEA